MFTIRRSNPARPHACNQASPRDGVWLRHRAASFYWGGLEYQQYLSERAAL